MNAQRVALVTGGAQGIGKAIAQRFLRERLAVVIADVDGEAGRETAAELAEFGPILFVPADVGNETHVRRLIRQAVRRFKRLDVLINNAGISGGFGRPLARQLLRDWDRVLATNLTGAYLCAKHASPHLRKGRGAIVNISSTRAVMSEPHTEAYAASKGGICALTHALALSLGPEVRVNAILPGWIETSPWKKSRLRRAAKLRPEDHAQHPAGRVGTPEDIAAFASFLASPDAGFVTGANFVADGGMTRKMIYIE